MRQAYLSKVESSLVGLDRGTQIPGFGLELVNLAR